jgi:hypothetical protein
MAGVDGWLAGSVTGAGWGQGFLLCVTGERDVQAGGGFGLVSGLGEREGGVGVYIVGLALGMAVLSVRQVLNIGLGFWQLRLWLRYPVSHSESSLCVPRLCVSLHFRLQ